MKRGSPGLNLTPMESLLFLISAEKRCVPGQAVPQAGSARRRGRGRWSGAGPGVRRGFPVPPSSAKSFREGGFDETGLSDPVIKGKRFSLPGDQYRA
jgi:hypothetical protein